ncbi:MAG: hypothetical protein H6722_03660 [Sandaracinus sp.]|nr:hypothetical protein [Sandaracinus sp.]
MKFGRFVVALAAALTVAAGVFVAEGDAGAQRLRASIFLTQNQIPRNLTERGLIAFARRNNARRLRETTDQPIPQREWVANMVTSFNTAPGDLEFQVLFYDIEQGDRFIGPPLSTFINNRQEKTFLQRVRLERPRFKPNRRMEMRVVVRRQEVGRQRFELIGEEVRHSGTVSFGADDT